MQKLAEVCIRQPVFAAMLILALVVIAPPPPAAPSPPRHGASHFYRTRPVARLNPYTTPDPRLFLCSSSTPPGGGVHGMCGYYAARAVLQRER